MVLCELCSHGRKHSLSVTVMVANKVVSRKVRIFETF